MEQMTSSVDGFTALQQTSAPDTYHPIQNQTYWISSLESTEGTNSLLMNSPVGTRIDLLSLGIATETGWDMVVRKREDRRLP